MPVRIETFRPEHGPAFVQLNLEWLTRYNLLEPPDEEQLADPVGSFAAGGGQVLVAVDGDVVVATCAATPHGEEEFEIAKLAVSVEYRGQGIARQLVERCIAHAWAQGARRIVLVSNSQLQAALGLYESFGFTYCDPPDIKPYETADIFMELHSPLKP